MALDRREQAKQQAKIIKAYSISIITTIKELLKLNPLFKEELQIFLGHSDFAKPGKLADFAVALTTSFIFRSFLKFNIAA